MNKIFLGGTWNGSTWRGDLMPMLKIDYFDPIVEDWTEECKEEEIRQKNHLCNIHLYHITKDMTGVFSMAEVVESAMQGEATTVFSVDPTGFGPPRLRSLEDVSVLVNNYGARVIFSDKLEDLADLLNGLGQNNE